MVNENQAKMVQVKADLKAVQAHITELEKEAAVVAARHQVEKDKTCSRRVFLESEVHELKRQLAEFEIKVTNLEAQAADSAARGEIDDATLANFSCISTYADVVQMMLPGCVCKHFGPPGGFQGVYPGAPPDADVLLSIAESTDSSPD